MESEFPKCVKEFIHEHIHSLTQLDILLVLQQDANQFVTVEQITNGLYIQSKTVNEILLNFVRSGLAVRKDDSFRFAPATDTVRGLIGRLAQLYRERRVAVIAEVFAMPIDSNRPFPGASDSSKSQ